MESSPIAAWCSIGQTERRSSLLMTVAGAQCYGIGAKASRLRRDSWMETPSTRGSFTSTTTILRSLYARQKSPVRRIRQSTDLEHLNDRTEELVSTVTYPILNEHLAAVLTGEHDPERALRKLRRLNPGVICVTLGGRGAAALDGDRFHILPAAAVTVVDNTGAGDAFRGAFIYGVLQEWSTPEILRFANATAGNCCTRLGAIAGVPTHDETRGLLAEPSRS
jgi:hypothetical protein